MCIRDRGAITGVVYDNVPFGASSPAEGTQLPPASYNIGVAAEGTTATVAEFSGLALAAGDQYTAVAAGLLAPGTDQPGFQLLLVDHTTNPWTVGSVAPDAR